MTVEKLMIIVGFATIVILGIVALIGAAYYGATHQLLTAGMCTIMGVALYNEYKEDGKDGKDSI